MIKPQKYVRNSGLRSWEFAENDEGVPTWSEITVCVFIAACVGVLASVIYG